MPARYIVIEGPIGVGKTSLARLLAERFQARLELEDIESNPFLMDFYRDQRGLAFKTQIFFLLNRYQRQRELWQQDLFNRFLIADYLFAKDRIFAYANLDDYEVSLYERIYRILEPRVVKPDLVVYLQAEVDVLLKRVRKRCFAFEREMSEEYLERISEAYNRFFFHYSETPLLTVNATNIDFIKNRQDLEELVQEINSIEKGTLYFNPLRSRALD